MADNGVRYYVAINGQMQVISALNSMEGAALKTDASMAALAGTMRSMAGALGLGIGAHALISFGKDAVQGAADFETAMKRIKFSSQGAEDGFKNQQFIFKEAAKFKIPLQDATDSYGKFLAMVHGSGMAGEQIRTLHDQLLLIGKIKGLDDGQLSAGVMNLGKMLEAGAMDARHLRPLEQQLSGIAKYIADEMGTTIQNLAVLRNKGKLTGIDPEVLLRAIKRQAQDLEEYLPESLKTIQGNLNEVSNSWLIFKNQLVYDNLGNLQSLFGSLKDGIGWLQDHEEGLISFGKAVIKIGEGVLIYKTAMGLANLAGGGFTKFTNWYLGNSTAVISATERQAIVTNQLALAMERVALATEAMATAQGITIGTGALSSATLVAQAQSAIAASKFGAGGLAKAAAIGGAAMAAIPMVAIAYFAADALSQMANNKTKDGYKMSGWDAFTAISSPNEFIDKIGLSNIQKFVDYNRGSSQNLYGRLSEYANKNKSIANRFTERELSKLGGDNPYNDSTLAVAAMAKGIRFIGDEIAEWRKTGTTNGFDNFLFNNGHALDQYPMMPYSGSQKGFGAKKGSTGYAPPNDAITGQRVITINNNFKEINGVKEMTVQSGGKVDKDAIGRELRDIIVEIANDQQIRQGQ